MPAHAKNMRANRLLSELLLLQSRRRVSTRELAGRMEISPRTAHRDMEALCHAGVPLVAFRGSQGGWELSPGWRAVVPALDEQELRAMMLAQPKALGERRLVAAAERALNKLVAAMPSALQSEASAVRSRIHVDATGWGPWSEDLSALPAVQEAVMSERRLRFDYRSRGGHSRPRTVDPLGLVCKQNSWYLVARADAAIKTFRVSRISNAVPLEEGFSRPAGFDLAAYWSTSTAELAARREQWVATLGLPPAVAGEFAKWSNLEALPEGGQRRLPRGWRVYRARFEDEEQALFVCLGLGANVQVLEPDSLRQRRAAQIRKLTRELAGG